MSCTNSRSTSSGLNDSMWFRTKAKFLEGCPHATAIPVSRDTGHCGVKEFAWAESSSALACAIQHLHEQSTPISLNELSMDVNQPCRVYFDVNSYIESGIDGLELEMMISTFLEGFERTFPSFLQAEYGLQFQAVLGKSYQVASATRRGKLHLHISVDIGCKTVSDAAGLRDKYESYLAALKCDGIFAFEGNDTGGECIIDKAVYKNFQSYRTLYSQNFGKPESILLPYGASSQSAADHMVFAKDVISALLVG